MCPMRLQTFNTKYFFFSPRKFVYNKEGHKTENKKGEARIDQVFY